MSKTCETCGKITGQGSSAFRSDLRCWCSKPALATPKYAVWEVERDGDDMVCGLLRVKLITNNFERAVKIVRSDPYRYDIVYTENGRLASYEL